MRFLSKVWTIPLPRIYLVLALVLGLVYAFVTPPFGVNDEAYHVTRVYELSTFRLVTRSDDKGPYHMVPRGYQPILAYYRNVHRDPEWRIDPTRWLSQLGAHGERRARTHRVKAFAGSYTPVPYVPHLLGMWLARLARLPLIWQLYVPRLFSVVCFALLGAWSIRLAGRYRWLFFALGLIPMALVQAAGVSGDGVTAGLAFAFFALATRGLLDESVCLGQRERRLLLALGVLLTLCKPVYFLLLPVLWGLRPERPAPGWRRHTYPALVLGLAALGLGIWAFICRDLAPAQAPVLPKDQLAWMAEHPLRCAFAIPLATLASSLDDLLIQCFAIRDILSTQLRFSGTLVAVLYLELLLVAALAVWPPRIRQARDRFIRRLLLVAGLLTSGSIFLAMQLTFTRVGASRISGVQGRYFVAVLPSLFLAVSTFGRPWLARWVEGRGRACFIASAVALNAIIVLTILSRYYASFDVF